VRVDTVSSNGDLEVVLAELIGGWRSWAVVDRARGLKAAAPTVARAPPQGGHSDDRPKPGQRIARVAAHGPAWPRGCGLLLGRRLWRCCRGLPTRDRYLRSWLSGHGPGPVGRRPRPGASCARRAPDSCRSVRQATPTRFARTSRKSASTPAPPSPIDRRVGSRDERGKQISRTMRVLPFGPTTRVPGTSTSPLSFRKDGAHRPTSARRRIVLL